MKIDSILEPQSNKSSFDDKYNQVDVLCQNSHGEIIYIEIQFYDEPDYFHRIIYSTSKIISDYIKEGQEYEMVKKVFSVNILYIDLGSGADYVYHGQMDFRGLHTEDKLRLSELQKRNYSKTYPGELFPEVYLIKVNNFNDISKDTLDEWIYFLKHTE